MASANKVDWENFKETYNRIHGTDYKTAAEWVTDRYNHYNKFVSPLAEEIGVGFGTMKIYLQKIGIHVKKPRGGAREHTKLGSIQEKFLSIPDHRMKQLTRSQIAEICGGSKDWINKLLLRYKRSYTKVYDMCK